MNPLREGQKPRPPPLVSPRRPEESHPRKSHETGLFRPFDSSHIVNGYDSQPDKREQDQISGTKTETAVIKYNEQNIMDKKYNNNKDLDSQNRSTTSAFHSLTNHIAKSENESSADLHSVAKETSSSYIRGSAYSAPLNVPAYNMSLLQSSISTKRDLPGSLEGQRQFSQESQNCVSKLDMEERRKSESKGDKSVCSDSECELGSEDEDDQERKLLISSGPPLKLDTSPKKIKLFSELGLTTFSQKKGIMLEICMIVKPGLSSQS